MKIARKPYFNINEEPCLEQSVIVVADILGFSKKMEEAFNEGNQQNLLIKIHNSLSKALRNVHDPSGAKWYMKLYSDNLIVGYRFLDSGKGAFEIPQACHNIGHFQREMISNGFLIRGGIAIGSIHMSENMIFGQILEELKKAEDTANYPRVVLLDSAMNYLNTRPDIMNNDDILWKDVCDGVKFINYLYQLGVKNDIQREKEVQNHKQYIESGLVTYKSDGKVLQKYKWLANYHNRFCQRSGIYNDKSYMTTT